MSVLTAAVADGASLSTVSVLVDAVPVNPATGVVDPPQFHVVVGAERMIVTAISGLTMTCTRIETDPAAHAIGEQVGYYDRFGDVYGQLTGSVELTAAGLEAEVDVAPPAPDVTGPPVPTALTAIGGFRGFGVNFAASTVPDLMFNEIRFAPDTVPSAATPTAPDTTEWRTARMKVNTAFIATLEGEAWYWVQVRSIDTASNVVTSLADSTAVDYLLNPEAGWSTAVSVRTTLVGAADIAFGQLTSDHIATGALDASDIGAGTLVVRPQDSFANGIEIRASTPVPPDPGTLLGRWDENGIRIIDPTDSDRFILMDSGEIKLTVDGGEDGYPTAITPEGINATKITFGEAPGGHNLVLNSSFELAAYGTAAASTILFTDTTKWATAAGSGDGRISTPDNLTEGTALTMTSKNF